MGFGDFQTICRKSALPLCALVGATSPISGSPAGIQANCYARSVELANTIIFEAATDFMHILALGMAAIMVLHVRSKFTAVGKRLFDLAEASQSTAVRSGSDIRCSIFRSQRNHHLLLHLHGAYNDFLDTGLRRVTPTVRLLSLHSRRPEWLHIRSLHLPPGQWLRGVSTIRGWHEAICLATPWLFRRDVYHIGRRIDLDVQGQSRIGSNEYTGFIRRAISTQRYMSVRLLGYANHTCREHATGSMAIGRHHLWSILLRSGSSDPLRF